MYFKNNLFFLNFICVFGVNLIEAQIVSTTTGSVLGQNIFILDQIIEQYLGIPYAMPPIGSLRFAKPKPIEKPIEGVIDGTKPKYSCIQPFIPEIAFYRGIHKKSEDCLTLNIWTQQKRSPEQLKPVMFWIYGGAFFVGSIFQTAYNGSVLATHDVVVVSVNYRLGWFGFLYGEDESAPGNAGLYDQNLALQWVWENIHMFGGDKNQITLIGESSGSWSVAAHILSPLSKGLFKRAIMMSGVYMFNKDRPVVSKEEELKRAKDLAKSFLCFGENWLQCLRAQNAHDVRWYYYDLVSPLVGTEFMPLMAHTALEQGQFYEDVDILAGITENEGTVLLYALVKEFLLVPISNRLLFYHMLDRLNKYFHNLDKDKLVKYYLNNINDLNSRAIRNKMYELTTDLIMKCPTYGFAKLYAQHSPKQNVYFYELTHKTYNFFDGIKVQAKTPIINLKLDPLSDLQSFMGVYHSSDIPLLFGRPFLDPNTASPKDTEFTKEFMKLFTDFVKYGNPDPNWPKLVATDGERGVIRNLNPNIENPYISSDVYQGKSCSGVWKDYF